MATYFKQYNTADDFLNDELKKEICVAYIKDEDRIVFSGDYEYEDIVSNFNRAVYLTVDEYNTLSTKQSGTAYFIKNANP